MKKILKNSLYMLVAGALVASCADYNVTDDFHADPDPSVVQPYREYNSIKSYIDRVANPNLTIGASLDVTEFNKQELAHSVAIANFDNVTLGKSLMASKIINARGVMNFLNMMNLLDHMEEIGGEIYGSPLFANTDQADEWINLLTAAIEVPVDFVPLETVDFSKYQVGTYPGTIKKGKPVIKQYEGANVLNLPTTGITASAANIVEGFKIVPNATYNAVFYAKADKDASFFVNFSGNKVDGTATSDGKWALPAGKWTKFIIDSKAAEDVTDGYLEIEIVRGSNINIQKVELGYYPDNHRNQTEQEIADTISYAINAWCDGLMKINEGRIKSFDLIDEPINTKAVLENGMYDLKHSATKTIFWQDVLGSEKYAPVVDKVAREAFEKHGGNPADLKFFISETGLENETKMKSLNYWMDIWANNGAKLDGINAKINLVYNEKPEVLAANKKAYETLLDNLVKTGKLVRISNFDIKYIDASGLSVTPAKITEEQRQNLAEFNAYAIKTYISKVPQPQQAGICKGSLLDTNSDPVGLWLKNSKTNDWVRTATYKAWCEALSGK